MSSPLEATRDGGHFMNETVNGDELPKVYQKMVPNFKYGTNLGNIQKLHPRTRPYEYQTQEKVRFLAIPRTIVEKMSCLLMQQGNLIQHVPTAVTEEC